MSTPFGGRGKRGKKRRGRGRGGKEKEFGLFFLMSLPGWRACWKEGKEKRKEKKESAFLVQRPCLSFHGTDQKRCSRKKK